MFYEFTTLKGEKFVLNIYKIEYFTEAKRGTLIVCDSGMDYVVDMLYDDVKEVLHSYYHKN